MNPGLFSHEPQVIRWLSGRNECPQENKQRPAGSPMELCRVCNMHEPEHGNVICKDCLDALKDCLDALEDETTLDAPMPTKCRGDV